MKKTTRIFSILLIAAMLIGLLGLTASAAGTEPPLKNGYYEISTAEHLVWFADQVNNNSKREYNAKLMADIDLSTVCSETLGSWDPIYGYKGIFDGNGKEIKNLYVANQDNNGFIGRLEGENAQVLNLTVRGVVYADQYAGGIVGNASKGKIENCTSYVDIYATGDKEFRIGGIIGSCGSESSIINCWNYGDLNVVGTLSSQNIHMGGIAGYVGQNVTIDQCANYGKISTEGTTVNATANLGGIVGTGYDNTVISNCYNQGEVHLVADSDQWGTIGGILGNAARAMTIRNTFSNAVVHKTVTRNIQHDIGALVGDAYTVTIENCFWNSDKTTMSANGKSAIVNLTNVAGYSAATLATGEIAYHMGEKWGQQIGTDAVPVLGGMKVYQNTDPASTCSNPIYIYSNTQNLTVAHDMTLGAEAFTNGVCNNCGYVCTHPNSTFTYSNVADTTHDAMYTCCNKILIAQAHTFSQTGLCPCGMQAAATVTVGGVTEYYGNFVAAITAARSATEKPFVKLLDNVTLTEQINIRNMAVGMELDFAGKTIYCAERAPIVWLYDNGTLILRDSVGGGGVTSGKFSAFQSYGTVEIYGGTFRASVNDNATQAGAIDASNGAMVTIYDGILESTNDAFLVGGGKVIVYGGSITSDKATFDVRNGSIEVYGAQFPNGIAMETYYLQYAVMLSSVLAPDCYIRDAEGNLISTEGSVYSASGPCFISRGADLENVTIEVGAAAYTGSALEPAVTVAIHGRVIDPANYTVSYSNNVNAGNASVTITAKGDVYTGTASATFTIEKGTPTVTAPTPAEALELTWTGLAKNLLDQLGSTTGGTLMYNLNGGIWDTNVLLVMDPGTYTLGYKVVGDENWNDVEPQYITIEIAKRDFSNPDHRVQISLDADTIVYDGTEKKPVVSLHYEYWNNGAWYDRVAPISADEYTVTYSENVNAGTATITVTALGINCTGTITTTFEITPRVLTDGEITLDSAEFTYNATQQKPVVSLAVDGKTLVEGVDYTLAWPEDLTNAGTKTIEITGNYAGSFSYEIRKANPVLVVTSPISSVLSGNKVKLTPTITYGELTEGLPTEIVITDAANATWNGMIITVNDDLIIGQDVVTITAASAETANFNAATYTLTLEVGMEDYSAAISELEQLIEELKTTHGADVTELEETLTELQNAVSDLGATDAEINDAINGLLQDILALQDRMTSAEEELSEVNELIAQIQTSIEQLQQADVQNAEELETAIKNLNEAVKKAEEAAIAADGELKQQLLEAVGQADKVLEDKISQVQKNLEETSAELQNAISNLRSSLQRSINAVASDLEETKAALEAAIRAGNEDVNKRIDSVYASIAAAKNAMNTADAKLQEQISAAETALQAAIELLTQNLVDTKAALETAIAAGDAQLEAKVEAVNTALSAAKAALEKADQTHKAELTAAMNDAYATLNTALEALQQELAETKAALEKADADNKAALEKAMDATEAALQAKDQQLQNFIIIVCVVSGIALSGSAAFVIWFFLDRKKTR